MTPPTGNPNRYRTKGRDIADSKRSGVHSPRIPPAARHAVTLARRRDHPARVRWGNGRIRCSPSRCVNRQSGRSHPAFPCNALIRCLRLSKRLRIALEFVRHRRSDARQARAHPRANPSCNECGDWRESAMDPLLSAELIKTDGANLPAELPRGMVISRNILVAVEWADKQPTRKSRTHNSRSALA